MRKLVNKVAEGNNAVVLYLLSVLLLGVYGIALSNGVMADADEFAVVMVAVSPTFVPIMLGILMGLLHPIQKYIRYLTHEQVDIDLFEYIRLPNADESKPPKDAFETILVYGVVGMLFVHAAMLLWLIPFSVLLLVGTIYGVSRLSRFVFGIAVKLKSHVDDPNAHKKVN